MEAKRTEVLNLIHAGFTRVYLQLIRISGVSKTTFYKVKKRDSAERAQMSSPVNKKVDKKLTEKFKKHVENNPTMSIRKTAKLFNVVEKTVRRSLKTLGKVIVTRTLCQLLTERLKTLRLERSKKLLNQLKSHPSSTERKSYL